MAPIADKPFPLVLIMYAGIVLRPFPRYSRPIQLTFRPKLKHLVLSCCDKTNWTQNKKTVLSQITYWIVKAYDHMQTLSNVSEYESIAIHQAYLHMNAYR